LLDSFVSTYPFVGTCAYPSGLKSSVASKWHSKVIFSLLYAARVKANLQSCLFPAISNTSKACEFSSS